MVPFNLKVLAKFGLCSNCSQKLDECSLAHARQIFCNLSSRMLGLSLMAKLENIGGKCTGYECFWKHASYGFADAHKNSSRKVKAPPKVEGNLQTGHEE